MIKSRNGSVQRQGRIYRFSVNETAYAAFVWKAGAQFYGRIEGNPHVPQSTGSTAIAVRDKLQQWLVTNTTV